MLKVSCGGCASSYQVDERRVPHSGLKMRCPTCGESFVVKRDGTSHEPVDDEHPAIPSVIALPSKNPKDMN
jgi:predicted Zn finger-like uncharacterized protein